MSCRTCAACTYVHVHVHVHVRCEMCVYIHTAARWLWEKPWRTLCLGEGEG